MKKFLLFDMDGVLLAQRGYHRALAETVHRVGQALGYANVQLGAQEIASFEAAGITSEWDSAAICAVWLMMPLWEDFPSLRLPLTLHGWLPPEHRIPAPTWEALIEGCLIPASASPAPLQALEDLLAGRHPQESVIREMIRGARETQTSLTHRIFQELVLGSEVFARSYGLKPALHTESYLRLHDRPALTPEMQARLWAWLQSDGHRAAIFTNRPSQPPGQIFCPPEAQIGAVVAGLEGLPIVGYGDMLWLAEETSQAARTLRKPSPVHALAALLHADGLSIQEALHTSLRLCTGEAAPARLGALSGAQVWIFEDTPTGLMSARAAEALLAAHNIPLDWQAIGISDHPHKASALRAQGATVYDDLNAALRACL